MNKTVMSEVTRLCDLTQAPLIKSTWGRSYKRVTSDMTVLIIGTWGRSYKCVTSDMTVLIIGTWGMTYLKY
jgi:thiamine pyrophosphate-dependent acetolactate synthase large subunit-like protein